MDEKSVTTLFEEKKNDESHHIINKMDEKKKLANFLANGLLYDVTIKTAGVFFKLHRFILASSSNHFAHLFASRISESDEPPNADNLLPNDEEHPLEEIDPATFTVLVEYMYSKKIEFTSDSELTRVLKAADILKIPNLIDECYSYIKSNLKISSEHFVELLNHTYGNEICEKVYSTLCKRVIAQWPEIGDTPHLGSISWHVLKSILFCEKLRINSRKEIMDICSKWISHDVMNRYTLLPRIALAIKRYCTMDYGQLEMEIPKNWSECSQQFIATRLWEILSSNTLIPIPSDDEMETEELLENPMFIVRTNDTFDISDANMKKIISLRSPIRLLNKATANQLQISAAMIGNNLFFVCVFNRKCFFQVFNILSKKLVSLAADRRMLWNGRITLLNCNNQVYCCFQDGDVMKYSAELNRWVMSSVFGPSYDMEFNFASTGNMLYRTLKCYYPGDESFAEVFDFHRNSWIFLPLDLRRLMPHISDCDNSICTINGNLAVLCRSVIFLFDNASQQWRNLSSLSSSISTVQIFTRLENCILLKRKGENCYVYDSNGQRVEHKGFPNIDKLLFASIHNLNN